MRVTANSGTGLSTAFLARRPFSQQAEAAPSASKNLIVRPVSPASSPEAAMPARPLAAFLAQLIAKAQDLPASRERRRADAAEGARLYRTVAGLGRPNEGKNLRVI
jgi:hypothetical protein